MLRAILQYVLIVCMHSERRRPRLLKCVRRQNYRMQIQRSNTAVLYVIALWIPQNIAVWAQSLAPRCTHYLEKILLPSKEQTSLVEVSTGRCRFGLIIHSTRMIFTSPSMSYGCRNAILSVCAARTGCHQFVTSGDSGDSVAMCLYITLARYLVLRAYVQAQNL